MDKVCCKMQNRWSKDKGQIDRIYKKRLRWETMKIEDTLIYADFERKILVGKCKAGDFRKWK